MLHGGVFGHPNIIVQEAEKLLRQYRRVNDNSSTQVADSNVASPVRWYSPLPEKYKANWDTAVDLKEKRIGIGVIIRDRRGMVFVALSKTIRAIYDPTTIEAVAALYAIELSRDTGLTKVLLEGDSNIVVMALNGMDPSWCRYGQVIDDAKAVLNTFHGWEVRYVKREANKAAHNLAKEATRTMMDRIWLEETPNSIFDTVNLEQLGLSL